MRRIPMCMYVVAFCLAGVPALRAAPDAAPPETAVLAMARNRNWEAIFDRLIDMREREGLFFRFVIQVDTLCHRIPNFIEKAARAGVTRVFLGLENINPDSLKSAKKRQNRIAEYREMLLAWKAQRCFTYAGYILGFPNDTLETIVRDIKIIQLWMGGKQLCQMEAARYFYNCKTL